MDYNSHAWRAMSNTVRMQEPYCRYCDDYTATVDHIDGNTDNNKRHNLQALCLQCHNMKTAAYEKKQQPLAGYGIAHLKQLVYRKLSEQTFWEIKYTQPGTFNPPLAAIKIINIDGLKLEFVSANTFCNLQLKSFVAANAWGLQIATYVFAALARNENKSAFDFVQHQLNQPGMVGPRKSMLEQLKSIIKVNPLNVLQETQRGILTNGNIGVSLLCDMFGSFSQTHFESAFALFQFADIQHTLLYEYAYRYYLTHSLQG